MNKIINGVVIAMTNEEIAAFEANRPTDAEITAQKWKQVRSERNFLLAESDWVVTRASDTGVAVSDEWKTYRQALRDVPTQSDPGNITWPTKPS